MNADDTFQHHIFLKVNAADSLEKQLQQLARKHGGNIRAMAPSMGLVVIGTATDPYQPVEAKAKVTRECLKVLAKYAVPVSITTRSPLILRDLDILQDANLISINISVGTLRKDIWRNMEPASPAPDKRLETVQQLTERGLPAGIFVAPILPFLTDTTEDLEPIIAGAKTHHARFVKPSVLRLAPEVKEWFFQTIQRHYPHLLPRYQKMYRSMYPSAAYIETVTKRAYTIIEKYRLSTETPDWRYSMTHNTTQDNTVPSESTVQLSFTF